MPSIIDPHPDWMGLLAQRIKAAAQSQQRWLALLAWLIELALARLAAFAGDVRALQLDKAFQRDLRSMVRFAEGMLRLAIRDAAGKIAFYRVHPNEALPARLRDHLAGLRLRPLRSPRPPHLPQLQPPPPRPPSFRVTLPFPGAPRSGEPGTQRLNLSGNAEALGPGSRPVRARPGNRQPIPGAPRSGELRTQRLNLSRTAEALDPGSRPFRARPGSDAGAPPKRRRGSPSSAASLLWRLLALQRAMPQLEKYAWRLAKAEARRTLMPPRPRPPAPPSRVCSPPDPSAPAPHAAAQRRLEPG